MQQTGLDGRRIREWSAAVPNSQKMAGRAPEKERARPGVGDSTRREHSAREGRFEQPSLPFLPFPGLPYLPLARSLNCCLSALRCTSTNALLKDSKDVK